MSEHRGIGRLARFARVLLACFLLQATGAQAATTNAAPVITGTPPATAPVSRIYDFRPVAYDPDRNPLVFRAQGVPAWARFDRATGRLTGTPRQAHLGRRYSVLISVSDGKLSATLPRFTITVVSGGLQVVSRPPTIGGTPPSSVTAGSAYSFTPTASDPDGQPITFSIANRPTWAGFSTSTGQLSGTPDPSHVGTHSNITITVSDGQASATLRPFSITVVAADRPPVIGGTPPSSVVEGELYGFLPTASDPDGDPLVFSITGKPGWATFTANSGLLSGVAPAGSAGTYSNIRISVSAGSQQVSLPEFSITVTPRPNSPPSIWGIPQTAVEADQGYAFQPSASDPEGQPLSFSVQGLPEWAGFDTATGRLSGTPAPSHAGSYANIVISVSDGKASSSLAPFSITVSAPDLPPTIRGTPAESVNAGSAYSFTPTASDPEGQPLSFAVSNRPTWLNFDPSTGRLSGTPEPSHAGTHAGIVISVSDGRYSASLGPFSVTVVAQADRSATVSWVPPTSYVDGSPMRDLAGFRITYGQSPEALSQVLTIASPVISSAVIEGLAPGTWCELSGRGGCGAGAKSARTAHAT